MHRLLMPIVALVVVASAAACTTSANVEEERSALLARDREWSQTTKDTDRFLSYFAADASVYGPGMPAATGTEAVRKAFTEMSSAPGFALSWNPEKADVSASGDLGYTSGTFEMTTTGPGGQPQIEKGSYLTTWKKQDGQWKVTADMVTPGAPPPAAAAQHQIAPAASLTWGDPPPALPKGSKLAVVSGDPTQAGQFVIRLQLPAGYRVAPHWHPTAESVTVLSGTFALGMGDTFDEAALQNLPAGGYAMLPAEMRHFAMAKSAATIQLHGMGPFVLNYVNPADDPRGPSPATSQQ